MKWKIVLLFCFVFYHLSYSQTVRDTIYTTDMDRIIISYDIKHTDNTFTVYFNSNVKKKLGVINKEKYNNLSKIEVLFFDRTGNYCNGIAISGLVPQSIMIPSNVQYGQSTDGFFVIQDNTSLTFKTSGDAIINIPLYLAYHSKKGKYTLFSKSKEFRLILSSENKVENNQILSHKTQVVNSISDKEPNNNELIKIVESINLAQKMITESERLPFSESLIDEVNYLRQKRREISDDTVLSDIIDILDNYEAKKKELEEKASEALQLEQQQAEYKAKLEAEALQAKNDSIAKAQQLETQRVQKRNLWLVIGGVILAILGFIGNQLLQHYRNLRNQKNMINMQQSIIDKAEREAKRKARTYARSTSVRMKNSVETKVSKINNKKSYTEKNKKLSI